ncbi:MAG TPA: M28 family metallopeptidase [Candidatus Nitrosocosmicus sp.]|nr:M28 family metallopeptidase [Candidatus Nitrosocosmicus sp.]
MNESEFRSILEEVSTDNLKKNLNRLSDFHTRHSKSPILNDAGEFIMKELKGLGYMNTFYHYFGATIDNEEFELRNIVCEKKGIDGKLVIICAHYDSIMNRKEDSNSRAPGANDNGSGVSGLIEIARVLHKERLKHSVQFVFFSGEEQGLLGSKSYAKYIKESGIDLHRLINLDMIGYPFLESNTVIIERDNNPDRRHNRIIENDVESIKFGEIMRGLASTVGLQFHLDSIYDSDYEPFETKGYIVIGVYDGSADPVKNPHYHSSSDLPRNINWNYLTSVVKLVLATVLKIDSI